MHCLAWWDSCDSWTPAAGLQSRGGQCRVTPRRAAGWNLESVTMLWGPVNRKAHPPLGFHQVRNLIAARVSLLLIGTTLMEAASAPGPPPPCVLTHLCGGPGLSAPGCPSARISACQPEHPAPAAEQCGLGPDVTPHPKPGGLYSRPLHGTTRASSPLQPADVPHCPSSAQAHTSFMHLANLSPTPE